ncbi:hypothetical protein Ahy_B04g069773 isoform B [Arachis hypogaea]|uniref:Uncharacterized protein n=1 Tax=Arachis hypogaea TaxID=3818 RepID=A0A444ZDI2_ARAHY|nr:hypothetical protein Ahy_B04g069773 isoform A [Arachis hypogaea]RYR12246.1 hypothetical protein Ahy_B04g069773 isoform B [Arachis hypogaea]
MRNFSIGVYDHINVSDAITTAKIGETNFSGNGIHEEERSVEEVRIGIVESVFQEKGFYSLAVVPIRFKPFSDLDGSGASFSEFGLLGCRVYLNFTDSTSKVSAGNSRPYLSDPISV